MKVGGMATNKAEVDTSAPFRSVKEAVMLFGERVLANEVYANKLKEMQDGRSSYSDGADDTMSELEEAKQSLQKARDESIHMARCLSSLQRELEQTKRELHQLKNRSKRFDLEIDEDLKFVEGSSEVKKETITSERFEFQKKKYVTFANPPSTAARQVLVPPPPMPTEAVFQRHPSLKKKKKKHLIPFIGGIFSKIKKGNSHEVALA